MALVQCTCQLDTCPSCQFLNTYSQSADPQDTLSLSVWKSFVTNASMRLGAQHDAEEFLKVLVNVWEVSELTSPTARQDAATFFSFFGHRLRLKVMRTPACACYDSLPMSISFGQSILDWMFMLDLPPDASPISVGELVARHFQIERAEGSKVVDACPCCQTAFDVRRQYECMPSGEVREFACCVRRYDASHAGKNRRPVHINTVLSLPWGYFGLRGIVQHLGASWRKWALLGMDSFPRWLLHL